MVADAPQGASALFRAVERTADMRRAAPTPTIAPVRSPVMRYGTGDTACLVWSLKDGVELTAGSN